MEHHLAQVNRLRLRIPRIVHGKAKSVVTHCNRRMHVVGFAQALLMSHKQPWCAYGPSQAFRNLCRAQVSMLLWSLSLRTDTAGPRLLPHLTFPGLQCFASPRMRWHGSVCRARPDKSTSNLGNAERCKCFNFHGCKSI